MERNLKIGFAVAALTVWSCAAKAGRPAEPNLAEGYQQLSQDAAKARKDMASEQSRRPRPELPHIYRSRFPENFIRGFFSDPSEPRPTPLQALKSGSEVRKVTYGIDHIETQGPEFRIKAYRNWVADESSDPRVSHGYITRADGALVPVSGRILPTSDDVVITIRMRDTASADRLGRAFESTQGEIELGFVKPYGADAEEVSLRQSQVFCEYCEAVPESPSRRAPSSLTDLLDWVNP